MNRLALLILVAAMTVGAGLAKDDEVISTSQARCDVFADILLDYGDSPLLRPIPANGDPSDVQWQTVNDIIGGLARLYACPPATAATTAPADIPSETPTTLSTNVEITFPPRIYVVRNAIDIRGTVASSDLGSFFIEFRPLMQDLTTAASWSGKKIDWLPATLPQIYPVRQGVLGRWNTTSLPEGLYELRVTLNVGTPTQRHVYVGPTRVENHPPSFQDGETDDE